MRCHLAAGNRAEALRVYADCRALLAEELGVEPAPETARVYLEASPPAGGGPRASTWMQSGRPAVPRILSIRNFAVEPPTVCHTVVGNGDALTQ